VDGTAKELDHKLFIRSLGAVIPPLDEILKLKKTIVGN
jgi:hypothetical protein